MKHAIPENQPGNGLDRILSVMRQLRDKEDGCPWDVVQTFETIVPYTIEEAYEVADAIERKDTIDLREELGDLLLQVVFHAQIAEEDGLFSFDDVAQTIADKMIHRHPHVFGDRTYSSEEEQRADWNRIKSEEKAAKHAAKLKAGLPVESGNPRATLRDTPTGFPALTETDKVQRKAAQVGFDHPEMHQIYGKVDEELAEVKEEAAKTPLDQDALEMEVGDLLFVAAAVGRRLNVDPERALHRATAKFVRRFNAVEHALDFNWKDRHIDELNDAWDKVKQAEKTAKA
ncbi:MAG: nucleoside triphosphate pyrophosphohydrolase [Alphaproteobacteria bacterium]